MTYYYYSRFAYKKRCFIKGVRTGIKILRLFSNKFNHNYNAEAIMSTCQKFNFNADDSPICWP